MVIKRVGPISCAKIAGTLYAILGLFFGAIFSVIALAGFAGDSSRVPGIGAIVGVGAVVIFPICYGALGFIFSLIGAWLYNALAAMVGGVELDVQ